MMILATMVLFIAIVVVCIPHQATAEVCISTVSNNDNKNDNAETACNHLQNSNDDPLTAKDKTPFLLAIPFP
ncbi:MAG TPA: hypothetical protein VJ729_17065 [Nitrososphaeraceae archaeon]|nr:hypothetical protein [Nitrososphaeraceae archaeon]